MNIRILPAAKADLRRGYRFYERQAHGVGAYFLDALYADIDSIQLFGGIHGNGVICIGSNRNVCPIGFTIESRATWSLWWRCWTRGSRPPR